MSTGRRAGELQKQIEEYWQLPTYVPDYLVVRLDTVIGDAPVVYMDVVVTMTEDHLVTGHVCALTSHLVVSAPFSRVPASGGASGDATVEVKIWPRAALSGIDLAEPQRHGPWVDVPGAGWPRGAKLVLSYDGRPEPLLLPLSDTSAAAGQFAGVLPALLGDLSRR